MQISIRGVTFMLLNYQKVRKCVKNTEYTVYFKPTINSINIMNPISSMGRTTCATHNMCMQSVIYIYVHSLCLTYPPRPRACGPCLGYIR